MRTLRRLEVSVNTLKGALQSIVTISMKDALRSALSNRYIVTLIRVTMYLE